MIWLLFGHLWWALPALVALVVVLSLTFGAWPLVLGAVGRVPPRAQALVLAVAVGLIAGSGMYAKGRHDGKAGCAAAQAKAEDKADVKAAKVATEASEKAGEAKTTIRKESSDAQSEARDIVHSLPAGCPAQPDRLRELGESAVEAASRGVPAGTGR